MRGAGESAERQSRFYNAGLDTDLLAVLETLAASCPRLAVVGFSLGANLSLLALGRQRERVPRRLAGGGRGLPPLDLAACAQALEAPGRPLLQLYFMGNLRDAYSAPAAPRSPDLYESGRERDTAPCASSTSGSPLPTAATRAPEYYARSSAGPWLASVDRPALILAAEDDPMVPPARSSACRCPRRAW